MLIASLVACGGGNAAKQDGGASDAGPEPDSGVARSSDLGKSCPMGCNLTTCVSRTSTSCENGICIWDGRTGLDSYCSQACDNGLCPPGWDCLESDDGEGSFCFARPADCGNGILERGELCDPGPSVGTPESGCASNCFETITGGSVSLKWDGSPIEFSGTSAEGKVDATANDTTGFVNVAYWMSDLSIGITVAIEDLEGPFPRIANGRISATATLQSWCFLNPGPSVTADVVLVEAWEDGYHLSGSFDGTVSYSRCCSSCVDPATETHQISDSHFEAFLAQPVGL